MPFYEKGDVRIRYEMVGSGFPLLVTPGGGLNSRVSNWPTAVFNAMEAFKGDFRCITMDQRNANGGESTGPIPASDPWGAFADDQLGLMDHLSVQTFFYMGYCIGGPFGLKLIERAGTDLVPRPDTPEGKKIAVGEQSGKTSLEGIMSRTRCSVVHNAPQSRNLFANEMDPESAAQHFVLRWVRGTHHAFRAVRPPSTGMIAPVRNDAAGRHRLSVMCATSSGSP